MRICCLTAHPDDLEIGAAGTLLKYQSMGAVIDSIILVKPSEEVNPKRSRDIVLDEASSSYQISGFNVLVHDTALFDNGRPNLTVDTNTVTAVSKLIDNKKYDLVLLPSCTDWHQDHRYTHSIGMSIFARHAREIWAIDAWPYCLRSTHGNIKVDITEHWSKKSQMINCYKSYVSDKDIDAIKKLNQYWGVCADVEYAESFTLINKLC